MGTQFGKEKQMQIPRRMLVAFARNDNSLVFRRKYSKRDSSLREKRFAPNNRLFSLDDACSILRQEDARHRVQKLECARNKQQSRWHNAQQSEQANRWLVQAATPGKLCGAAFKTKSCAKKAERRAGLSVKRGLGPFFVTVKRPAVTSEAIAGGRRRFFRGWRRGGRRWRWGDCWRAGGTLRRREWRRRRLLWRRRECRKHQGE